MIPLIPPPAGDDARRWQNEAAHWRARAERAERLWGIVFGHLLAEKVKTTPAFTEADRAEWTSAVAGDAQ